MTQLEDRLDEMREQLELWVLRAGAETIDPSPLRGLLHVGGASEEIGDAAQQLVWLVEQNEEMHPVLAVALGETDDVVVRFPIAAGSALDGAPAGRHRLGEDTGFHLLAIRRGGRYLYRPRGRDGVGARRRDPGRGSVGGSGDARASSAATASSRTTTPVRSRSVPAATAPQPTAPR